MIYDWYKLFSLTEFVASGLVARTMLVLLEDRGRTEFQIYQGNETSVAYDDVFLPANFLGMNPYVRGSYAIYLDPDNYVWFGFEVPEE